jgi:hypothetical protein
MSFQLFRFPLLLYAIFTESYEFRLVGGTIKAEGYLEVRPDNTTWGRVTSCPGDTVFSVEHIICDHLGYPLGGFLGKKQVYDTDNIHFSSMQCILNNGNQTARDCIFTPWDNTRSCSRQYDTVVTCITGKCTQEFL